MICSSLSWRWVSGVCLGVFITTMGSTDVRAQSGVTNVPNTTGLAAQTAAPVTKPQPEASSDELLVFPQITPGRKITLTQALIAVDKRNLSLRAARVELEKADALRVQALSDVLPFINSDLSFLHNDHADAFDIGEMMGGPPQGDTVVMPQHSLKGSLTVGVPLIRPQSWALIKAGKKGIVLTSLTIEEIRQQLLLRVAEAYFYALMAHQIIDLHVTTIETFTEHLKVAKAKLSAGAGLRIDVIRADSDRDQAYQQLLTAHLAFDNARDILRVLTATDNLPMPVAVEDIAPPQGTDEALIEKALTDRPDMKTKQFAIDLEQTHLYASWMQFVPTLDSSFQGSYQFIEPGDLGSPDRSRWLIMLQLSIPLYNQFRYADLDYRRAVIRQATIEKEETALNASMAVRQERRNYLTALALVEIAERQALMNQEALTLVLAAYQAGTGSSLEVTDARRTTLSADISLARKKLESQIALLALLHAIGEDMSTLTK